MSSQCKTAILLAQMMGGEKTECFCVNTRKEYELVR